MWAVGDPLLYVAAHSNTKPFESKLFMTDGSGVLFHGDEGFGALAFWTYL